MGRRSEGRAPPELLLRVLWHLLPSPLLSHVLSVLVLPIRSLSGREAAQDEG